MKNLTLGDFCPSKNAPPSLDQCIFDLRATQTENERLRDEIDRLDLVVKEKQSEIFALECQINELQRLNSDQTRKHPLYASMLKPSSAPKFTVLGKVKSLK